MAKRGEGKYGGEKGEGAWVRGKNGGGGSKLIFQFSLFAYLHANKVENFHERKWLPLISLPKTGRF